MVTEVRSRVKKAGDGTVVRSHRPLRGRNVFLHLLGWRGADKFEENLKLLGASIEKCFSREVNVLITNQGVAKDYERLHSKVVSVSGASPTTPSPFNLASIKSVDSPQPESSGDAASRKPLTRGQSIALRATRNAGSGDVIENARRWKIKIIHIEQAQKYVQREIEKIPRCDGERDQGRKNSKGSTSKHKVKRLQGNFIKFEASNRQFRPVMKSFTSFPSINASTPFGTCPFDQSKKIHGSLPLELDTERAEREEHNKDGEEDVDNAALRELEQYDELNPADIGSPPEEIKGRTRHGSKEKQLHCDKADVKTRLSSRKLEKMAKPLKSYTKGILHHPLVDKVKAELKHGYCETCEIKYNDIDKHVKTEQHKRFARQSSNYQSLDELIQQGPNMEQFLNDVLKYQELHKREAHKTDSGGENAAGSCVVTSRRRLRPRHNTGLLSDHQSCSAKSNQPTDGLSSEVTSSSHLPRRKSLRRNLLLDVAQNQNRLPQRSAKSPSEVPTARDPLRQSLEAKTKTSGSSAAGSQAASCDQLKGVSSRLRRRSFVQKAVEVRRSPRLMNVEHKTYVKEEESSFLSSLIGMKSSPLAEHRKNPTACRNSGKETQSQSANHSDISEQCPVSDKKTRSSLFEIPPGHRVDNLDLSPWNRIPAVNVVLLSPRVFVTPLKDADVRRPMLEATQDSAADTVVGPSTGDIVVQNKSILRKPGVKSPLKKVIFHQNDVTNEGSEPMRADKGNTDVFIEGVTRLTSDPSPCNKHIPENESQEDCGILASAVELRNTHRSDTKTQKLLLRDERTSSEVATTQSPPEQTIWGTSNIADSSLSANQAIGRRSPRKLSSRQSSLQSPEKLAGTGNELPRKVTTRHTASEQTPAKQTPQKLSVRQTPTKATQNKQTPTKETAQKRTISQTPTKETPAKQMLTKETIRHIPTKQTPTKRTPTKETPKKRTISQTPTKQTPQKRTIRETPTKQTPTKQTPQKRTISQTPTKQTPQKRTISQTPTKQTPQKRTISQTPTKQTPQKRTISQTPTKQTPQKRTISQTPTKQTPTKQTSTKQKRSISQTPTKQTPTKQTSTKQKRSISQTPTKQTPQKRTIRQTPTKQTPQKRTIRQTPSKLTPCKQTPQKQTTRQMPTKQTPQKVGRRLTWKWGSDESPTKVTDGISASSKQRLGTQNSPQKSSCEESLLHEPSSKEEGLQDIDTSGLHSCEAKKEMKSCISDDGDGDDDDDDAECSSQKWIIYDELDTCDVRMIGQPRDDSLGCSSEFVPASDNSTDGQQTAIQLPPINVQEKFCMEQGTEGVASSPIYIALHDSPCKDSDRSEGWDSQVESFLNCVHETKGSASPGISLRTAWTPNEPTAGQGERSPLRQLDGLAAGGGKDGSVLQAAGLDTPFSRSFGKRGADSNVVLCSPRKRSAVGEPVHCSTPSGSGRIVDENADGVGQEMERKRSSELHWKECDVHAEPSQHKQSLRSKQNDGTRPLKSRRPSPLLGHNGHNKFDYLQLSKRFSTRAPLLVPKHITDTNEYTAKKGIKTSVTSDCQVASASSDRYCSFSPREKSCSGESQNSPSSLAMETIVAKRGKDCALDGCHVVPKLTLDKKVAMLAAKAKSNLDNSLYTTPKHAPKSKNSGRKHTAKRLLSVNYSSQNKRQCRRDVSLCGNDAGHTMN